MCWFFFHKHPCFSYSGGLAYEFNGMYNTMHVRMSCTLNISLPQELAFWNMLKILETRQTKYVELNTEQPSLNWNWPFFPHGCCRGVCHFGFTEKVYGLPCTVRTLLLRKCHHRNVIVGILFTVCHSSGSSPKFKMIVRELLAFTQPNRHETFTAFWNPYCRVSSRGRRAQILFSREAHGKKKQKTIVRHFGFMEKVYGLPCMVRTFLLWKPHGNVVLFTVHHSSGSSLKAGCLC